MPLALITGASTGIGRATALRLAASGWRVLAGVRGTAAGEGLSAEAPAGRLVALQLDVTVPADVQDAVRSIDEHGGGKLDALINNAGIAVGGPLELISLDDLRRQFEVNVFGQVALLQATLPALRRAAGRVVFLSSIGGHVTAPFTAPYGASKHAIEAFGDALRIELASSRVQVTLIEPGSVATPIWDKGKAEAERFTIPPELEREYGRVLPVLSRTLAETASRGVPPEQVAATIERALAAKRMRARYLVGRDARVMLTLKRLLPDRVFDRLVTRALGL